MKDQGLKVHQIKNILKDITMNFISLILIEDTILFWVLELGATFENSKCTFEWVDIWKTSGCVVNASLSGTVYLWSKCEY